MYPTRLAATKAALSVLVAIIGFLHVAQTGHAQPPGPQPVHYRVSSETQKLDMTVNTSRILTMDFKVPRVIVENDEMLRAMPMSDNQIHITALQPGITSMLVWDEQKKVHVIDIRIYGDIRELQDVLRRRFPEANVHVEPINASLLLSGYVPRPETVNHLVDISREYFPRVLNHLEVGGAQTIALHVKVMEVSRTKLRRLGVDWALLTGDDFIIQSVSGLVSSQSTGGITGIGDTIRFGIMEGNTNFGALINFLQQNNLAKLLAEPTIVTTSGRPARFNSGGEVPVPVAAGLGVSGVEYRQFGTIVDFVPIVMGNGMIRLEVRPNVTELDGSLRDPVTGTPGFRSRGVDTGVVMRAGQTLALAGLIQNRVEAERKGIPWLSDLPWFGVPFRKVQETVNEVELLIMVTPEIVAPVEPHMMPPCGPGQNTTSPCDAELYGRGYLEVPTCCTDGSCPQCRGMDSSRGGQHGPLIEELGPGAGGEVLPQQPSGDESTVNPTSRSTMIDDSEERAIRGSAAPAVRSRTRGQNVAPAPNGSGRGGPTATEPSRGPQNPNNASRLPAEARNQIPKKKPTIIGPIGYDKLD